MSDQLDRMEKSLDKLHSVLAGDEFNDGLIKDHKTLKERFYETRQDVRKIKIIGGVVSAIITGLIGIISLFE